MTGPELMTARLQGFGLARDQMRSALAVTHSVAASHAAAVTAF